MDDGHSNTYAECIQVPGRGTFPAQSRCCHTDHSGDEATDHSVSLRYFPVTNTLEVVHQNF